MATRGVSTMEKLLTLVDDIEILTKELLESTIAPKQEKLSHKDQLQLIKLAMVKNESLVENLALAKEQAEIEDNMRELSEEVNRQDQDIQTLQKNLKEAENLLSTALYQARQKLDQINQAQSHPVNSEDLIRFAHRISSTNAVAAPLNWQAGDPRRPYPTDFEMRMGYLAKLGELPLSAPPTLLLNEQNPTVNPGNPFPPWHPHAHNHTGVGGTTPEYPGFYHPTPVIDPSTRNHEDVEVMSTDSSSSSSSDSQ